MSEEMARSTRRTPDFTLLTLGVLALGLRLLYVFGVPQTPVVWDAAQYDLAGQAVSRWLGRDLGTLLGGILHWRPEVLRAFASDLSGSILSKGPTYPLFLGFIYLIFGHHVGAARGAQAILDTGTVLLVAAIARILGGRRAGYLAAGLYAVYQPMILMTGRLLQETLMVFLLALMLWLILRGAEETRPPGRIQAALTGMVLGAIVVGRPALQYLFVPVLPATWLAWERKGTGWRTSFLGLVGGMLLLVVPVTSLIAVLTGRIAVCGTLSAQFDPGLYHGILPHSLGWWPDLTDQTGQSILTEGGNPEGVSEDRPYLGATLDFLKRHPLALLQAAARKAPHYFSLPCADWQEHYLLPRAWIVALHQLLVLGGILGAVCCLPTWRRFLPLAAVGAYILGICAVIDTEVRYAIPLLAIWTPLAGVGLARLGEGIRKQWRLGGKGRVWVLGFSAAVMILALPLLELPRLLPWLPGADPATAWKLHLFLEGGVLLLSLIFLDRLLDSLPGRRARRLGLTVAAVGFVSLACTGHRETSWHEWKVALTPGVQDIEQTFLIPPEIADVRRAFLVADVLPQLAPGAAVRLQVGEELPVRLGAEDLGGECFRRYLSVAADHFQGAYDLKQQQYGFQPGGMRKWLEVELAAPPTAGETLRVTLGVEGRGRLEVYGDYLSPESRSTFEGPSFDVCRLSLHTSFYKADNDGDYRIWERTRRFGDATSRLRSESGSRGEDLSGVPGLQTGRYRIFLMFERADGTRFVVG